MTQEQFDALVRIHEGLERAMEPLERIDADPEVQGLVYGYLGTDFGMNELRHQIDRLGRIICDFEHERRRTKT